MTMKNRNVLFTVLGIIVLVVLMIGVFYHFRDRRTYTLNLPKLEKLESISLKQNEKNVIIDDKEKMQDEVHNYTINYHKQIRSKGSLESILDNIEGIGSKRKKELLKKYHTINKIKEQSVEDLSKILPEKIAKNLLDYLNEENNA